MRILLLFMLMVLLAVEPLGAAAPITAAAWTPDGQQVVLGSQGGIEVRTWPRLETMRTLATELEHVHDLRFSPDGQRLLAAGGSPAVEGAVEVLSWPEGKRLLKVAGHDDLVYRAAWSPAGTECATAAADGSCQVFAADTGKQLARYTGHARAVLSLCYLPDNTTIASVGVDQTVRLWESATGKHLRTLDNHVDTVNDVAVRPGGNEPAMVVVATISEDRTVRLWQPSIGRLLRFARLPSAPRALVWSATGELLYVGCNDGHVRTLDPDSMEVVHDSNGLSPGRIHELLLSAADGQLLVAGESGCRLVDVKSEE